MSDKVTAKPSDYEVGYRRPPKATQFAVGNKANPAGRPKGSRSVGAVLQDIMRQKIVVTENGKTRRIATLEIILRRLANEAMRSDPAGDCPEIGGIKPPSPIVGMAGRLD